MASTAEIFPGAVPSRGALRPGGVLSAQRGANAGLVIHPQGHRAVSAWCGADSSVDVWSVDLLGAVSTTPAAVELSDTGASIDQLLMPPGVDASRSGWPAHLLPVVDLAASTDGKALALAAGRGVRLYHPNAAGDIERAAVLRGHEQAVVRVALSSAGDRVVSSDGSGRVLVWSVPERRVQLDLKMTRAPHAAAFLWSDRLIGIGDDIGRVVCWELQEGRRHLQFQAHRGPVQRLVFSQEAGALLTVGADQTARLWNLETGKQSGADIHHAGPIHDATFACEGRFVVTVGGDGHVAVWSAATGKMMDWCFEGSPVYRVAYHEASGMVLYSGPRSIRVAEIDWTALKQAEAGGAPLTASSSLFSIPQTRPTVTFTGALQPNAPVGSVMAARQTSDQPVANPPDLLLNRDPQPVASGSIAFPIGGSARPFGTQALPSIGGGNAGPQFGGRPGATVAMSGIGAGASNEGQPAHDLRSFTANKRGGLDPRNSTATGSTQTDGAPGVALANVDDFFADSLGSAEAGSLVDLSGPPGAITGAMRSPAPARDVGGQRAEIRPAMPPVEAPSFEVLLRGDDTGTTSRMIPTIAPPPPRSKRILYAGVLLGFVCSLVGRVAGGYYYTEHAYPPSVATEANGLASARTAALESAQSELDTFRAEREERLFEVQRAGSLSAPELERLRGNIVRQVATAERDFELACAAVEAEFESGRQMLEASRRAEAATLGARYGTIAGGIAFLLAFIAHLSAPRAKPDTAKPTRGSRPANRSPRAK